MHSVVTKIQ